jgi:hypothetical protein
LNGLRVGEICELGSAFGDVEATGGGPTWVVVAVAGDFDHQRLEAAIFAGLASAGAPVTATASSDAATVLSQSFRMTESLRHVSRAGIRASGLWGGQRGVRR